MCVGGAGKLQAKQILEIEERTKHDVSSRFSPPC